MLPPLLHVFESRLMNTCRTQIAFVPQFGSIHRMNVIDAIMCVFRPFEVNREFMRVECRVKRRTVISCVFSDIGARVNEYSGRIAVRRRIGGLTLVEQPVDCSHRCAPVSKFIYHACLRNYVFI